MTNETITIPQSELAAYQRAIESAKTQLAQLERERDEARAEAAQAAADYAMLRGVVRLAFSQNGSEQSMRDLWNIVTNVDHPGAALNIRFNRGKAVIDAARRALGECPFCRIGRCRAEAHEWLRTALAAYDAPLKEGVE